MMRRMLVRGRRRSRAGFAGSAMAADAAAGKAVMAGAKPACKGCHTDAKNPLAKAGRRQHRRRAQGVGPHAQGHDREEGQEGHDARATPPDKISDADLDEPRGLPGHDEVDRAPARADPGRSTMNHPLERALLLGSALLAPGRPSALRAQECLDCHGEPGSSVSFKDGESRTSRSTARPGRPPSTARWASRCTDCHAEHQGVPAPRGEPTRPRGTYTLRLLHLVPAVPRGAVQEAARQRPPARRSPPATRRPRSAPTATTRTRRRRSPATTGKLLPEGGSRIPRTCARCHGEIYAQYRQSVHGTALVHGNPDVPTCIDCHGVHDIPDPTHRRSSASPRRGCAPTATPTRSGWRSTGSRRRCCGPTSPTSTARR